MCTTDRYGTKRKENAEKGEREVRSNQEPCTLERCPRRRESCRTIKNTSSVFKETPLQRCSGCGSRISRSTCLVTAKIFTYRQIYIICMCTYICVYIYIFSFTVLSLTHTSSSQLSQLHLSSVKQQGGAAATTTTECSMP